MGSSVRTQMAMRVGLARELFRKDCKKNHENCLNISQTRNSSKDMQKLWSSIHHYGKICNVLTIKPCLVNELGYNSNMRNHSKDISFFTTSVSSQILIWESTVKIYIIHFLFPMYVIVTKQASLI